ncbi:hypothetical protein [Dyella sp. C11]|uniref:hypothetical protein n=1 Tax=Dyella sp. C11 TaxID=2126991 RepID=UPI000D646F91|nr:hypothetical protein [Dyella sp. C11]
MELLSSKLERADRLVEIASRAGYALWQLQTLEGALAQYFVLVAQATKGMGEEAGNALFEKANSGTFGATITKLRKSGKLSPGLEGRFQTLLTERNWLVHRSRTTSGHAIKSDGAFHELLDRLDRIADETSLLLREIGKLAEIFVLSSGVPKATIDQLAEELVEKWVGGN